MQNTTAFDIITRYAQATEDLIRDASATHLAEHKAASDLVRVFGLESFAAMATERRTEVSE